MFETRVSLSWTSYGAIFRLLPCMPVMFERQLLMRREIQTSPLAKYRESHCLVQYKASVQWMETYAFGRGKVQFTQVIQETGLESRVRTCLLSFCLCFWTSKLSEIIRAGRRAFLQKSHRLTWLLFVPQKHERMISYTRINCTQRIHRPYDHMCDACIAHRKRSRTRALCLGK